MTCTCEKCQRKRVIDCLFVKVYVNLHNKCMGLYGNLALFLTQSTFTVKSDEYDGKYLLSVVAIRLVLRSCV